jgi:transcriptional regulator with XRE-family HTH domain
MSKKAEPGASLAQFLRDARIEKGLKQTEVTSLTGIAATTLSSYEVGRMSPELGTLVKLCKVYDKSLTQAAKAMGLNAD